MKPIKMNFNGTTCKMEILQAHEPKANSVDDMGIPVGNSHKLRRRNATSQLVRISNIARRPVSALWTANYTTSSSEAMNSGTRYYWKVRGLDGGGEQ